MKKIITVNSFRRGVGKTSLSTNLAVLLSKQGYRVALVDSNFETPSAHLLFGLNDGDISHTLNDYLLDKCSFSSVALDLTTKLEQEITGKLFLIPASTKIPDIMQILREPLNITRYTTALEDIYKELGLDVLLIDTSAGLREDTLASMAISDALIVVLQPDNQEFQGTAVIVDVAHKLHVTNIHLVMNNTPDSLDIENMRAQLKQTYHCQEETILPHSEELMTLTSSKPFVLRYPDHFITASINSLAKSL